MLRYLSKRFIVYALFFTLGCACNALITITIIESNDDVILTVEGTINLSDFSTTGETNTSNEPARIDSSVTRISSGSVVDNSLPTDVYIILASSLSPGPSDFGTGSEVLADSSSGDAFRWSYGTFLGGIFNVEVPRNYTSGDPIASTATWNDTGLADLGLTEAQYTWEWSSDSIEMNISTVPEPGTFALLASFMVIGTTLIRRRFALRPTKG